MLNAFFESLEQGFFQVFGVETSSAEGIMILFGFEVMFFIGYMNAKKNES